MFVAGGLGGVGLAEGMTIGKQIFAQFISIVFTLIYSGVLSFIILKIIDATIGLRVDLDEELEGLDLTQHNERGYNP